MGRGASWTANENLELARAWVSIDEDPIKGNEQKNDTFWGNINELWTAKTTKFLTVSLKCRFCSLSGCEIPWTKMGHGG